MITQAITEMKQKKGSSRVAILKHIAGATNSVPNAVLVKKTMKKPTYTTMITQAITE